MTQKSAPEPDRRESGLLQRIRKSLSAFPVARPHVLLACSGGKDSVALANILAGLRRLDLLTFSIAHIHHGQHHLADAAAEAVRQIGVTLDAEVTVRQLQQSEIDAHQGVGLEEALRRERYLALAEIAEANSADCIAIAHHQTDQAETILLHLMRGAGIDGLAGMREWELRQLPWWIRSDSSHQMQFWRPLIHESAADVLEIAESSGLPIVEDPTNSDTNFRRNAVRHQVIPILEEIAAGSTSAIARSAEIVARDADLLSAIAAKALQSAKVGESLSRAELANNAPEMQARVVRLWVLNQLPTLEISTNRVDAVLDLIRRNRGGASIEIGSGHRIVLRDGQLNLD